MANQIAATSYAVHNRERWNGFNAAARNGHMLFDRDFMDYHADRFVDASLIMEEDGVVVGLLPANRRGECIQTHGGLTFGGLVVGDAHHADVCQMLDVAVDWWRERGATSLEYKPLPTFYHRRPSQDDLAWLARRGATLTQRNVSTTIDLSMRGKVSSRRRRGAAKAAKQGLRFEESSDVGSFWRVLEQVLMDRHERTPVHSLLEIERLRASLPKAIRLYVATEDGKVVAGTLLFVSGQVWHAQYIASGTRGRQIGALDGLFLHLLAEAASHGARYFDFGISTEQGGRVLNEGLLRQKEEFGGSTTCYDAYHVAL